MHADLTRLTFDPALGFRSVLMQQGRVLLDAEWNEQTAITAHHDEVRTRDVVGRTGGPAPESGAPGPFAIVDLTGGNPPADTPWDSLGITPGRYYVDGVLAEAQPKPPVTDPPPPHHYAWPLRNQPYLRSIGVGVAEDRGLPEPSAATGDRFGVFLELFDHLVTADDRPELLESALGGPDTAAREQAVWQVRLQPIGAGEECAQLSELPPREPRRLVASLREVEAAADPCSITSGGGYSRLENQLYRVEIFDVAPAARYVWSRENGSVVAGLLAIKAANQPAFHNILAIDRGGHDDELSIGQGSLVEITSEDRRLRRRPGFLASVGKVVDLDLHVTWLDGSGAGPSSLASLGAHPIVRRWDGGPIAVPAGNQPAAELEDGIMVRFPGSGTPEVGDYWLIPARTVRLAYGTTARQGTIEWPMQGNQPLSLPPTGPDLHRAPLGILQRTATGWTLVSDCRRLFPPLTALAPLELLGGDGQEAMPGEHLPEPVRVFAAAPGVKVRFTAQTGGVLSLIGGATVGNPAVVTTGADGVAGMRWRLDPGAFPAWDTTQTLTIERLDFLDLPLDPPIIVTGRLSVADQVQWTPACDGFAGTRTVQDALAKLTTTATLRLLGGDGQEVAAAGDTVPQLVRVVVDSPCGPVQARVRAAGRDGARVRGVADGTPVPASLNSTGEPDLAEVETDANGVAAFVWQPVFPSMPASDVLTITAAGQGGNATAIQVTAQLDPPGSRTAGIHVEKVELADRTELLNDATRGRLALSKGIRVVTDRAVNPLSVQDKPVGRLLLDLPWPSDPNPQWSGNTVLPPLPSPFQTRVTVPPAGQFTVAGVANFPGGTFPTGIDNVWGGDRAFAVQTVEIPGSLRAHENAIVWVPSVDLGGAFDRIYSVFQDWVGTGLIPETALTLRLRFQLDGWAIIDAENPELHLNGHAITFLEGDRTRLRLPTTDEVTGGRFETWFYVGDFDEGNLNPHLPDFALPPGRNVFVPFDPGVLRPILPLPPDFAIVQPPRPGDGPLFDPAEFAGRTLTFATRRADAAGVPVEIIEVDAADTRRNTVIGSELTPAGTLALRVSRGATGLPLLARPTG